MADERRIGLGPSESIQEIDARLAGQWVLGLVTNLDQNTPTDAIVLSQGTDVADIDFEKAQSLKVYAEENGGRALFTIFKAGSTL